MLPIALSEFTQLFRNKLVLLTSLLLPVAISALFVYRHELFEKVGSLGYIAAVIMFVVTSLGLYTTMVTTLASRRQNLLLKRLRSTPASDTSILMGLLLPVTALALAQVTAILTVLAAVTKTPASVPLLAATVVSTVIMMLAFGLATAGLTNSPEHAQVTTLPVSLGTIGIATWVGITGTEELTQLKRLLPGGAATEVVLNAWDGGVPVADSLRLLLPTLGWVVLAIVLAGRLFRWEPRR
ncbi:ABC transporter permease [Streptomyces longwoodensis]|uniref:ABC transporter permease n=1 Tax=Streptomyces longwoodensis TaxID=68231 RepID=UPI0034008F82